ncbi:unnamed protein product [Cyberlindnera jadinii]|uniref:Uncharacterized protein n=1 Tax=Cyberlindnera jadinii (strain ATCC 18201 / CBS 1600 / BCRC 20928 / JCM 3617 / NBRC 0987 / NRRL Y-1542) TaxID=983966 RepID=A0A0H5C664_CYBJN|nr:unnamed protein product [Cyberlindnera jadinii]
MTFSRDVVSVSAGVSVLTRMVSTDRLGTGYSTLPSDYGTTTVDSSIDPESRTLAVSAYITTVAGGSNTILRTTLVETCITCESGETDGNGPTTASVLYETLSPSSNAASAFSRSATSSSMTLPVTSSTAVSAYLSSFSTDHTSVCGGSFCSTSLVDEGDVSKSTDIYTLTTSCVPSTSGVVAGSDIITNTAPSETAIDVSGDGNSETGLSASSSRRIMLTYVDGSTNTRTASGDAEMTTSTITYMSSRGTGEVFVSDDSTITDSSCIQTVSQIDSVTDADTLIGESVSQTESILDTAASFLEVSDSTYRTDSSLTLSTTTRDTWTLGSMSLIEQTTVSGDLSESTGNNLESNTTVETSISEGSGGFLLTTSYIDSGTIHNLRLNGLALAILEIVALL